MIRTFTEAVTAHPTGNYRPTRRTLFVLLISAMLTVVAVGSGFVKGGFSARMANADSTLGSGTTFVTASSGDVTSCTTVPAGTVITEASDVACDIPTLTLAAQVPGGAPVRTTASRARTLTASGSISPTAASYYAASCAPVQMTNTLDPANPLLPRGAMSFAQAGTWTGSTAAALDGSSAFAGSVLNTVGTTSYFSTGIWFKASPGSSGGALLSLDASPAQVTTNSTSRVIWMDSNGHLNAGTFSDGSTRRILDTTTDYRDGLWHLVSLTVGQNGHKSDLDLWVDGSSRAASSNNHSTPPATTGYWHIGWGDITGAGNWASGSAVSVGSNYFSGTLANAFVTTTKLGSTDQSRLAAVGSQVEWNAVVGSLAVAAWPLGDSGRDTYTGRLPGNADPCAWIDVVVQDQTAGSCVYPASATSCPAPSSAATLARLAADPAVVFRPVSLGSPQTLVTTVSRNTSYASSFAAGLHLLVPVRITAAAGGFGSTLSWTGNRFVI